MGSCLSKKSSPCSISSAVPPPPPPPPPDPISQPKLEEQKKIPQAEETIKKEIFVIKQRKSYEKHPHPHPEEKGNNTCPTNPKLEDSSSSAATVVVNSSMVVTATAAPVVVRTSSCTKEEVDAILIQCGRLSRSSSGKAAASAGGGGGHKYSGSKRSYDFDNEYYYDASAENNNNNNNNKKSCDDEEDDKYQQHHSRPSHRRTPSREKKDSDYKRSGSRDRSSSSSSRDHQEERKRNNGGSRRSSRSPARSETLSATATDKSRPGKMVSVPASVSTRDKNIESATTAIKRVSVKRSGEVVGLRTAASPRSKSPAANTRPSSNENSNHHQQVVSLSRNSSRKAEHSPYRRNPMSEIDDNCVQITLKSQDHHISTNKPQKIKEPTQGITKMPFQKPDEIKSRVEELPPNNNNNSQQETVVNCGATKQQQIVQEPIEAKVLPIKNSEITTIVTGNENLRPSQTITRSRSSRRSRDLDLTLGFNPDTLLNPTSYASLLLEDIHNFHQQNTATTTTTTTTFSLPPCVTKACSILEAVADLNSCTSSNNLSSSAFSRDTNLEVVGQSNKKNNNTASSSAHHLGKRRSDAKDPFVESEVFVSNDLLEPSLHKYVTLRRGVVMGGGETEQQESSGSNSYVGQHWVSPSSSLQDPNSADSTERWSSRSNTGEEVVGYMEEPSLIGCQKQVFTDTSACDAEMGVRKVRSIGNITALPSVPLSGKKREVDPHRRVGDRGSVIMPFAAAASM